MKYIKIDDFLTEKDIERIRKENLTTAREICDKIIAPNIERINRQLGQENDPMYLAYAVEFAIIKSQE